MVRVKRGVMTKKRHKKILKAVKGYRLLNSRQFSRAKTAWMKAGLNSYIGRKTKKRDFRRLWTVRINTAARQEGTTYSRLINAMYKKAVKLNRKVMVSVYGMRNRVSRLEGILYKTYPNLFTVLVDGEEKSFCYRDVITGDVKIKYL